MKNTSRFILVAGILAFATSCIEDSGTSYETADSNEDEYVNPKHIRGYGDREPGGIDSLNQLGGQMYAFNTYKLSQRALADKPSSEIATEMVKVYYERDRHLSDMMKEYMMAGRNAAGAAGDSSDNNIVTEPYSVQPRETIQDSINPVTGEKQIPTPNVNHKGSNSKKSSTTPGAKN